MTQPGHEELLNLVRHAVQAHQVNPNQPKDALRFWDGKTPYVIHPLWCAMTILHETQLPESIRLAGYQALLLHDVLEDTRSPLPKELDERVATLVQGMTFESFQAEQAVIWEQPDEIKLLKLYDKTSILLDAVWMRDKKWNNLVNYTLALADFVEETYGVLNIVRIARALAVRKE